MGDEVISVALWRGYVMGCFYARPAESDVAVAVSPSFRIASWPWERGVSLDRDRNAIDALDALQRALTEDGWQGISGGADSRWYQLSFLRPGPSNGNGSRLHVAKGVGDAQAGTVDLVERTVGEPANGHAAGALSDEIVAALRTGPLASSELCSRVGRPSRTVRAARRELELAGRVQKAAPPAGRSRRATYWQLSTMGPPGL